MCVCQHWHCPNVALKPEGGSAREALHCGAHQHDPAAAQATEGVCTWNGLGIGSYGVVGMRAIRSFDVTTTMARYVEIRITCGTVVLEIPLVE